MIIKCLRRCGAKPTRGTGTIKKVGLSEHARYKIALLAALGVPVDEETVLKTATAPENVKAGYGGTSVAEAPLDEKRVLRVVFVEDADAVTVITVYPARRGRYD